MASVFTNAWQAFRTQILNFAVIAVIVSLILYVWVIIVQVVLLPDAAFTMAEAYRFSVDPNGIFGLAFFAINIIIFVLTWLANCYYTAAASTALNGERCSLSELSSLIRSRGSTYLGQLFVFTLCLAVGIFLCGVGLLVAWFFLMFVPFMAYDTRYRNLFTRSGRASLSQPGPALLIVLTFLGLFFLIWIVHFICTLGTVAIGSGSFAPAMLIGNFFEYLVFGYFFCLVASMFSAMQTVFDFSNDPATLPPEQPPQGQPPA